MDITFEAEKSIVSSVMCNLASSGFAPVAEACLYLAIATGAWCKLVS